jgi:hypothetical protein
MKVRMLTTAAGPEYTLHQGKVYDLPRKLAELYLTTGAVSPTGRVADRPAAEKAPPNAKVEKIQYTPKDDDDDLDGDD